MKLRVLSNKKPIIVIQITILDEIDTCFRQSSQV